jgi:hypothetical protein
MASKELPQRLVRYEPKGVPFREGIKGGSPATRIHRSHRDRREVAGALRVHLALPHREARDRVGVDSVLRAEHRVQLALDAGVRRGARR